MDADTLGDACAELPRAQAAVGGELLDSLVAAGLADSRKAARRTVAEGGVSLNNRKVEDPEARWREEDFLHGRLALLKRGRKSLAAVERVD